MLSEEHKEVLLYTLVHRLCVLALLYITTNLQQTFDSSAWILLRLDATATPLWTALSQPLLRWDSLHFLAMASPRPLPLPSASSFGGLAPTLARGGGVQHDYSLAFQPGIVWLLRVLGARSHSQDVELWSPSQAIILTSLLATSLSIALPLMLFRLTEAITDNRKLARMAALLSILSPSPATLVTPTPETFFAFFALLGHLCLTSKGLGALLATLSAAVFYSLATAFRANGILLAGFVVWTIIWLKPWPLSPRSVILTLGSVLLCVLPFLSTQYFAWSRFCSADDKDPTWCDDSIPSIYGFVQGHYWNVGLLRYWKVEQLPNWIIAAPVLGLASCWVSAQYRHDHGFAFRSIFTPWRDHRHDGMSMTIPFAHYTLATLSLLVLTSHVQIALRFASPGGMPAVWWGAANLILGGGRLRIGKSYLAVDDAIVAYLMLWNVTSVVLYAGFYPPA